MNKVLVKNNLILLSMLACIIATAGYLYQCNTADQIVVIDVAKCQLPQDATQDQAVAPKMHKYRLNKLWRDKTVNDLIERDGAIIEHYPLNDDDYRVQIGLKIKEEAAEVDEALQANNKKDLAEEIADVYEVLDCIIAFSGLDKKEIESIQAHKRERRGSFMDRDFVTDVQAVHGSYLHNYYLKSPGRHQEILD